MASKKVPKKVSSVSPWLSSWGEVDKVFENFRRDLEKSFTSFPINCYASFSKNH